MTPQSSLFQVRLRQKLNRRVQMAKLRSLPLGLVGGGLTTAMQEAPLVSSLL